MPGRSGAARRRLGPIARLISVLVLATAAVAGSASAAGAHTSFESSSPRAAAVVQAPLATVALTFSGPVGGRAFVAVTGPGGRVDSGAAQVRGRVVTVPIQDGAPAGRYTVAFRVVAYDGHPVEGSYGFQLRAAEPSPSASAPAAALSSSPSTRAAPAPAAATAAVPADAGTDHSRHWFMGFAGIAMAVAGAGALVYEQRHRPPEGDGDT